MTGVSTKAGAVHPVGVGARRLHASQTSGPGWLRWPHDGQIHANFQVGDTLGERVAIFGYV